MKTRVTVTNVVFVDDDADEFYLFNEAIEQAELAVKMRRAKDGNDLIKYLHENELPDVIFMDLNMPYKDGVETLTELKSNGNFKEIPVIIFSTSRNANQINTCFDKGANMYVVKPETFDEISHMVKKVFAIDWKNSHQQAPQESFVLSY